MALTRCDNCQRMRDPVVPTAKGKPWCVDCVERFGTLSARIAAARLKRANGGVDPAITASKSGSASGDYLRNTLNTNRKEQIQ